MIVIASETDRRRASVWALKAPFGTRIEFKSLKRSLPQNALVMTATARHKQEIPYNKYQLNENYEVLGEYGGKKYFLMFQDRKVLLYRCPVCGGTNSSLFISQATCFHCGAATGNGFELDTGWPLTSISA